MTLPQRRIGDRLVSCLGLGCMPLFVRRTWWTEQRAGPSRPSHRALDLGITLLDAAEDLRPRLGTRSRPRRAVALRRP
jgi:aryl-alcohol dehydrogenase-like predicted oxidoreductase